MKKIETGKMRVGDLKYNFGNPRKISKKKSEELERSLEMFGDFKKALKIAKDFQLNITKEQHTVMTRAYECMVHPEFYRQIGTDISGAVNAGITTVCKLYGESG